MSVQVRWVGGYTGPNHWQPSSRRAWMVSTTPQPIYPGKRPGNRLTGNWVALGADLDCIEKISTLLGFDPRTFYPLASRFHNVF